MNFEHHCPKIISGLQSIRPDVKHSDYISHFCIQFLRITSDTTGPIARILPHSVSLSGDPTQRGHFAVIDLKQRMAHFLAF